MADCRALEIAVHLALADSRIESEKELKGSLENTEIIRQLQQKQDIQLASVLQV